MIEGEARRKQIMQTLANTEKPVSASKFAKTFGVSRQIIVGDIALLRAAGKSIVATARGYILETEETNTGHISKIAVQHGKDQTEEELRLIVENGGEIIDVIVEHPPLDGKGVKGIILFAVGNDNEGAKTHLKLLSLFARKLGNDEVVEQLIKAKETKEVIAAFAS
ncbi:HTH domain-containing protein [Listeria innocua]